MKYILIVTIIFLFSCSNNEYDNYVNYLENAKENIIEIVDINLEYIDLNSEVMYKITIDNPKQKMMDVEALVIHNYETEDIFPSFGILEKKYNLHKEIINENYTKGIMLIGYISEIKEEKKFKVLIRYKDENNNKYEIIKYIN